MTKYPTSLLSGYTAGSHGSQLRTSVGQPDDPAYLKEQAVIEPGYWGVIWLTLALGAAGVYFWMKDRKNQKGRIGRETMKYLIRNDELDNPDRYIGSVQDSKRPR